VEKAEAWLGRATDAAGSRAPLKKLREVLHAGVRLGADVPQVRLCWLRAAGGASAAVELCRHWLLCPHAQAHRIAGGHSVTCQAGRPSMYRI
jgi:hypothetical protein